MFEKCIVCNGIAKEISSDTGTNIFSGTIYRCHGKCKLKCNYYFGLNELSNNKLTGEIFSFSNFKIKINHVSKENSFFILKNINNMQIMKFIFSKFGILNINIDNAEFILKQQMKLKNIE